MEPYQATARAARLTGQSMGSSEREVPKTRSSSKQQSGRRLACSADKFMMACEIESGGVSEMEVNKSGSRCGGTKDVPQRSPIAVAP